MSTYIGIDVHKRTCQVTVLTGKEVRHFRLANEPRVLREFLEEFATAEVALEASSCWQPVYELLEGLGYRVKLAHPKRTRIIADAKIKTDVRDSEALARLLQLGWLPEAYVPPKPIRELRELVRLRAYLVRERTKFRNKIWAELTKRGICPSANPFSKRGMLWLRGLGIRTVSECLDVLEVLNSRIRALERDLRRMAEELSEARLLMSIPGVGYYSAMLILAEIGDVHRFPSAEKLCSYAGLVPSVEQSGSKHRFGPVTKEGSALLRWVLVQCAWMHLTHAEDSRLKRFFWKLARRKGKQIAIVATARKLLVAIYWMLRRGEPFRP